MSRKIMACIILSSVLIVLMFTLQNDAFAQMYSKSYPVKGNATIYSQTIPFSGEFSINMEYFIMIETHIPDSVIAGKSFEIIIIPNSGILTTSFLKDKTMETVNIPLSLGMEDTLEIPESMIGEVLVMPQLTVIPKITGPAHVLPESLHFDSEVIEKFHIFTDENIGIHDSITVELEPMFNLKNSGIINLSLAKIPIGEQISDIVGEPKISLDIPLKKFVQTQMYLQIAKGEKPESLKIKPTLMDENDQEILLSSNSVEIYINGIPKWKVTPNQWSDDFFVEPGSYNIQARFAETRDVNNSAITYFDSESIVQTITITPHEQNQTLSAEDLCPPDQIYENNECKELQTKDGLFGIGGGGCLIATATFGTELSPQVQFLREIRDSKVMSTVSGTTFMAGFNQIYYSFSPTISDAERDNPYFRELIKILISPMLATIMILQFADDYSEFDLIVLGSFVIVLNIGMYVFGPLFIIQKIYKHHQNSPLKQK